MIWLISGVILFFGIHFLPSTPLKPALVSRLGQLPYMGLFSVVSAIGLGLLIYGKAHADFIAVWSPPVATRMAPSILMLPALILLVCAYLPCNIKNRLRHPMLIGIVFWAIGHLIANGDLGSMVFFGSFALYSILDIILINRRGGPAATKNKQPIIWDIVGILVGCGVYAAALIFHQQLSGIALI